MKNIPSRKCVYSTIKPRLTPLNLSSLFLHMIVTLLVAGDDSPSVYTPVDFINVACGNTGPQIQDERYWTGDTYSRYSPLEEHQAGNIISLIRDAPPSSSSSSVSQVPYNKARLSRSNFTYRFSFNTAGQKFIRLYFYPASYGPDLDRSKALFSVEAGGYTFLRDFNASVTADAHGVETLYREFCLNVDEKLSLNITFNPSTDAYTFINGIQIVSMPSNLYYTAPQSTNVADYVGTGGKKFRIENSTALEMAYRINVGGNPVSCNSDTGMCRNWDGLADEQNYLDLLSFKYSSIVPQDPYASLNLSEYTAPKQVYQIGRSTSESYSSTTNFYYYNLTWEFPVDSKYSYLVRLHITWRRDAGFPIYIANQTAHIYAALSGSTFPIGTEIPTATYRDYVVSLDGPGSMQRKTNLSITLGDSQSAAIVNGIEIFKLNDSNGNLAGPNPDPLPPKMVMQPLQSHPNNLTKKKPGIISGILVFAIISILGGFLIFRRRWKVKSTKTRGSTLLPYLCPYFSLAEVKAATQNFNDAFIIGVGGFGNVYKGCLDRGATPVAIKRLKPESSQGAHEFKTEIELLSQLRYRHLVSLIGYCTDEDEKILIYDYMARGTLEEHLYHTNNPPLSWEQRLLISIGAARGLQYLHSGGAKGTIIHRDVKSTNILLDEKWVAKVSDFGLSKMGMTTASKTHISTMVKGSFGYLDPEYYRRQQLTEKSDVYSFGVVLFEILCARPALLHAVETRQMNLAEWARSCHGDGTLDQIIDPNLKGKIEVECLNKFIEIAMSCISDQGIQRPSMNDVVKGLEFALQLHQSCTERNGDNESALCNDTATNACSANESVTCISKTIFSEINDPNGR